jgi:hypothetical protein
MFQFPSISSFPTCCQVAATTHPATGLTSVQALAEATTPSFLSFAGAAINASVKEINLTDDVAWRKGGATGGSSGWGLTGESVLVV